MKRKGFLKNMIGALCAAVLISMPMAVDAAEMKDVVGKWTGNGVISYTIFDESGNAQDPWNTRGYHMESGTLEVTYKGSGQSDTVEYDLWRGEDIAVGTASYSDVTMYKIIDSGKMKVWNATRDENTGKWSSYDPSYLSKETSGTVKKASGTAKKKSGKSKGAADSSESDLTSSSRGCEHAYEWSITTEPTETADGESSYICTFCGDIKARQPVSANVVIRENLLASIKNAEAGTTVTFSDKSWLCYPQYILDALKEKGDISLKTDFTYNGVNYSFTIPAGSDYANLEPADFYGFMYLYGAFDGTIAE